jgi:dTDP-4-amino-4,6-dideoxy-D-galactose acyltransferase
MNRYITDIPEKRKTELAVYSPYSFLPIKDSTCLSEQTFITPLINEIKEGTNKVKKISESGHDHYFIYKNLKWDSRYFHFNINRIELIVFNHNEFKILTLAIKKFVNLVIKPEEYFFFNVPSEETLLIQAISLAKFRLVETRLNYYLPDIKDYKAPRHNVRKANIDDIPILKEIAVKMRNEYDRVHADLAFSSKEADAYLGTFVEETVRGFADMVMIPDIFGVKPFGFLAANSPQNILGKNIAKLVLAAVDNSIYKGWLFNLLSEVIYELKGHYTDYLTTITQASNRPAIRTWEKAGFRLGSTTHIFSYKKL